MIGQGGLNNPEKYITPESQGELKDTLPRDVTPINPGRLIGWVSVTRESWLDL